MVKWFLSVVVSLACSEALSSRQLSIVGEAYTPDGEQLLYREFHYFDNGGFDHRVTYQLPDGEVIVIKEVDYRSGFVTPSFTQTYLKNGELTSVAYNNKDLTIRYREKGDRITLESHFSPSGSLVIDAGFNHFIRRHWDSLMEGVNLEFEFPAPTRSRLVALRVGQVTCNSSPGVSPGELVCFSITPSSWFWQFLLAPIDLVYERSSRRLLRYCGVANITDREVDIRYRYEMARSAESGLANGR